MTYKPDLVQELIDERETNISVDHMELLQDIKPDSFWIFVEGVDSVFYRGFVFRVFGKRPNGLTCYGKVGVLRLRDIIELKRTTVPLFWKSIVTLYFVDKDHDDYCLHFPTPPPDVFVTDVYSVENYLVTEEVLSNLLEDALVYKDVDTITDTQPVRRQFPKILETFKYALREFHQLLFPFSIWLIVYKQTYRGKRTPREISPKVTIAWTEHACDIKVDLPALTVLDQLYGIDTESREAKARSLAHIATEDAKLYTRGKYESEFFLQFFRAAHRYLVPFLAKGSLELRDQLVSRKQFVVMISEKLLTMPDALSKYLHTRHALLTRETGKKFGFEEPAPTSHEESIGR